MEFLVIGVVAFAASLLTFFSGFGLGTLLLPAFAFFFSAPVALLATAIVHLLNNLFKGVLVKKFVDWPTVLKFGLPAIPAAIVGALLVSQVDERVASILIGLVLIAFALLELQPWFQKISFSRKFISLGGLFSGFMGGISGQQGALRSMFLLKSQYTPQQYVATGVLIAVLIDLARIPTYVLGLSASTQLNQDQVLLVAFGTIAAFLGAWIGSRTIKKATVGFIRYVVAALMILIGGLLVVGVLGG